jgi:hypothetical protein
MTHGSTVHKLYATGMVLALLGIIVLFASRAEAYQTRLNDDCSVIVHWPPQKEIPFSLNINGCGDIPFERCEAAVKAAFDAVQNIECTGVRFKYAGTTDITAYRHSPADTADGVNLIVWYESWPPDTGTSSIAVSSSWSLRNSAGEFVEFGIAMNGSTYKWADDLSSTAHDIQGVITSQILYLLGLSHSDSKESILDGSYAYGSAKKRTPLQDDIDGVCFLSPKDPLPNHWATSCPADEHCENTECVAGASPDAASLRPLDSGSGAISAKDAGKTASQEAGVNAAMDANSPRDTNPESDSSIVAGNGDQGHTQSSDGARKAECQFNSDCVNGRNCLDGKCVDAEKEAVGGCGCKVTRGKSNMPTGILLLLLVFALTRRVR